MMQRGTEARTSRTTEGRSRAAKGTLVAASLGFAVIQLDVFVVNVGVKQIGAALGGGTAALQWVVSAYTLMFAAFILSAGALADRFGARRTYSAGFVAFIASSVAAGLSPDMAVLVIARAAQGIGAALLGACSLALVNHTFEDAAERARAVGLWAAGAAAALSAGPVLGGVLIAVLGWRSMFFINVPIGLAGLLLTRRYADETTLSERRIDVPGQVVAVLAMGALAAGLIEGGSVGFSDPFVVGALVLGSLAAAAFFVIEATSPEPMLPLSLFRRGAFAGPALLGLVVNVAFYGLIFVFSLFFQHEQDLSALRAGLAFLPMTAVVLFANLTGGRLGQRIGPRRVILLGLVTMAVGSAGLLTIGRTTPFAQMVVPQVLLGAGIGLLVPPMTSSLMSAVEPSRSGVASGTLNTARQTGSMLGVAVFGSLVASKNHFVEGLHVGLVIAVVLAIVGAALAWPIPRTTARSTG